MKLYDFFGKIIAKDRVGNGACGRTERIRCLLPLLLERVPGGVIEIGAGYGQTTIAILEATVALDRRTYVIDPWADYFDGGENGYKYADFQKVIASYIGINPKYVEGKHLFTAKIYSQSPEAHMLTEAVTNELAFGFVDGDQSSPEPVYSDICMLAEARCRVICVDDIGRGQVADAVERFLKDSDYTRYDTDCIDPVEVYLILNGVEVPDAPTS